MKSKHIILIATLLFSCHSQAAEPEPGDSCGKEKENVMLGGDILTCTNGKYVVTQIGPDHNVGSPCWTTTDRKPVADKYGMICLADARGQMRWQRADEAQTTGMLIAVKNAGTGAPIASHTLQGWSSLSACQGSEEAVRVQVSQIYGGNTVVTAKCIGVSNAGAVIPLRKLKK